MLSCGNEKIFIIIRLFDKTATFDDRRFYLVFLWKMKFGSIEIWKYIKGYEGVYVISNFGEVVNSNGKTIKNFLNSHGYYAVSLSWEGKTKQRTVHQLVAMTFLDHVPCKNIVVDHIDNDKLNNHLSNLQVITTRVNTSKDRFRKKYTSKYLGVYWHKHAKKWCASLGIGKKTLNLGYFNSEIDAHHAYLKRLKEIESKNI